MLKLRISPGLASLLDDHSPESQLELAHDTQRRLEKSTVWFYEYEGQLKALSNSELTFVLEKSDESADWDYDAIKVQRTTGDDRFRMLMGKQVDDLIVYPATHTTLKNSTVNRVFVIVLNYQQYEKLPPHNKFFVNQAWKRAHKGRQYEIIKLGDCVVYQMTAITTLASTSSDEAELDEILQEYGVGRVTSDRFEVDLLRAMLNISRRVP